MARARDLLDRFRPAGAPGAASGAGVPTDRRADLAAELEPVFAALVATERECAAIRADADSRAGDIAASATTRAAGIVARARTAEGRIRAVAAAEEQRRADADIAAVGEHARRQAQAILDRARAGQADLLARILIRLHADLKDATSIQAPP